MIESILWAWPRARCNSRNTRHENSSRPKKRILKRPSFSLLCWVPLNWLVCRIRVRRQWHIWEDGRSRKRTRLVSNIELHEPSLGRIWTAAGRDDWSPTLGKRSLSPTVVVIISNKSYTRGHEGKEKTATQEVCRSLAKMPTGPTTFSAESYFATQPPPPTLDQDIQNVQSFVQRQEKEGRRIVLVTVRCPLCGLLFRCTIIKYVLLILIGLR